MTVPVLTFFNSKGGVGKTSLVFHLAWMFSEMGQRVVAIDLDPQASLTAAFLAEDLLEVLWDPDNTATRHTTVYQCVKPLTEMGDLLAPQTHAINSRLHLVAGDPGLIGFEDLLSQEWPNALGSGDRYCSFRVISSFWQIAQLAAAQHDADIVLADIGPGLSAINRSALIGTDHVVIPLAADLFSLQELRNLGPTLRNWRAEWFKRRSNWANPAFELPSGAMRPEGYVLLQHTDRLSRPDNAYKRWADRIPSAYRESVLAQAHDPSIQGDDLNCLAKLKHYRSLMPMAQEGHKPIFRLTSADGAIGSHSYAVREAWNDFSALASAILTRIGLDKNL